MEIVRKHEYYQSRETHFPGLDSRNAGTTIKHIQRYSRHSCQRNKVGKESLSNTQLKGLAKVLGGGNQSLSEEPDKTPEAGAIDNGLEDTEERCIKLREENWTTVDLKEYNTDGEEAKYLHTHQNEEELTTNEQINGENMKEAKFKFLMHLKTLI